MRFNVTLDKELLEILVCPKCKGKVEEVRKGAGLKCGKCKLIYPVKDGIPDMIIEDAEKADK